MGIFYWTYRAARSAGRRDRAAERRSDERLAAVDRSNRAAWEDKVLRTTALGHPSVKKRVSQGEWKFRIQLCYSVAFYGGVVLAGFTVVASGLTFRAYEPGRIGWFLLADAIGFASWFFWSWLIGAAFRRRINARLRKSGWDVKALLVEMKAKRRAKAAVQRENNLSHRASKPARLYPPPPKE